MLDISGSYSSPNGHAGSINIQADTSGCVVLVGILAVVGVIAYQIGAFRGARRKLLDDK